MSENMKNLEESQEQWKKSVLDKVLGKRPERKPSFSNSSNDSIPRFCSPLDCEKRDYEDSIGCI